MSYTDVVKCMSCKTVHYFVSSKEKCSVCNTRLRVPYAVRRAFLKAGKNKRKKNV